MNNQKILCLEKKIQKRWIISDTHFFHDNVIEFCNRPYTSVKKMNYDMIQKWNSVVGKNDIVYFLGDLALKWGEKERLMNLLHMLHGKKIMIMGNHDTKNPRYYLDIGFESATWKPIVIDEDVILSHYPPKLISKDYFYLFGHVHQNGCPQDEISNCFCVCADRFNLTPLDLNELLFHLKSGKKQIFIEQMKGK